MSIKGKEDDNMKDKTGKNVNRDTERNTNENTEMNMETNAEKNAEINKAAKGAERRKRAGKGVLFLKAAVVLSVLLSFVLLIGYLTIHNYYNKMHIVDGKTHSSHGYGANNEICEINECEIEKGLSEDNLSDNSLPDSTKGEIDALEQSIRANMENQAEKLMEDKQVFNILLIGCDAREKGERSRADSIILLSINKESEQLIATSIMRDIYVEIPGHGNNRINAAYAYGGEDLLVETVEKNFKIQIDRYASVDFFVFMDIVDQMGGVEIELNDEEFLVANAYINELNQLLDEPYGTDWLPGGGTHLLNGKQALGYTRIRYVGNADFERTKRQREVLEQIFYKAKNYNLIELNELLNIVLPQITTNLTEGEAITLALGMNSYKKYALKQYRLPCDDTWQPLRIRGMSVLGIDFTQNIQYLKNNLYPENNSYSKNNQYADI